MSATAVSTAAVIVLAVLTAAVGIYAARLWHLASMMAVRPLYADVGTIEPPGDEGAQALEWVVGFNRFVAENGAANQTAARWTAVSVALGAVTTIVGVALPYLLAMYR
jgi:hypothetical protein